MDRQKVFFFTRGRGRGHAVVCIEIARELKTLRPDVGLEFITYSTAAAALREQGVEIIDLGLPAANSLVATTVLAGRVIGRLQPDLVVAHEEAAALPAAKIFGTPTVFITDYFGDPGSFSMEALWFADRVLFLDRKGAFAEPPSARGRTEYVGPVLRRFGYSRRDRERARRELGLETGAVVVGVFPGSWTEQMAPFANQVLSAFDGARFVNGRILWLAGDDASLIRRLAGKRRDILVIERDWQIDRLMSACNLAITKSNRMTVRELAVLGIRTLSVSFGLNPPDEQSIAGLRSNTTIGLNRLTPQILRRTLKREEPPPARFRSRSCAAEIAKLL